jgi:hypothetical protein
MKEVENGFPIRFAAFAILDAGGIAGQRAGGLTPHYGRK